jgi:hypothetical protein
MTIIARLPKEELVLKMDEPLVKWAMADIKRAAFDGKAKLAGFIFGACLIDAMAGYYMGTTKQTMLKPSPTERFKRFVQQYLTAYNSDDLWKDLRCGLVHSYVDGGAYAFVDNVVGAHFRVHNGKTVLNLENFLNDIEAAYQSFRADILSDSDRYAKASKRYESLGIMETVIIFSSLS